MWHITYKMVNELKLVFRQIYTKQYHIGSDLKQSKHESGTPFPLRA